MGKKKGNKGGGDAKKVVVESKGGEGENKKKEGENKEKEGENGLTVVLKMDMHCEGCADKIVKRAKSVDGVEKVKAEWETNKLTVKGEMDPLELLEELQGKKKKKVEVVSPQLPKKDKDKDKNKDNNKSDNSNKAKDKKSEDKKPKEPPVIVAVLKLKLHCPGCIGKIRKIAKKTKGVQSIEFDKDKDLVAVKGAMDTKTLVESLKEKMKRPVEVIQPKKDKDGGGGGGGDGGGGDGGKKNKKGGGAKGGKEEGGYDSDDMMEEGYGGAGEYFGGNRMEYAGVLPGYGYGYNAGMPPGYGYNAGVPPVYGYNAGVPPGYGYNHAYMYGSHLHPPQMFSDENPNACHIM
ncbi:hypothetical protein BT93_D1983 [Corymbia citriodora subsp. variegata]|nr:hypothetical protein BT93_D1983 [Corymbia citriodora subsp. variegata]